MSLKITAKVISKHFWTILHKKKGLKELISIENVLIERRLQ